MPVRRDGLCDGLHGGGVLRARIVAFPVLPGREAAQG